MAHPHRSRGGANLPAKKYSKKTPTVTRLSFECPAGGATQFIDVGLALSAINRRFYRAGLFYYVNSVEVYNDEQGVVDILTAPDSWITKNAWNRGFQMFQKMNAMVDSPISNVGRPAYHDFKVYLSELHRTTGSLQPSTHTVNAGSQTATTDDWVYSEFVSADDDGDINMTNPAVPVVNQEADNFVAHLLGGHTGSTDNWTSVGLIKSYAESRMTVQSESPEDQNVDITDPLMNLFDFSSEEQMNDIVAGLLEDNDNPPYNYNNYLGETVSTMQHVARIGTETGLGRVGRASGFCAPLGLICIDPHSFASGNGTTFRVVLNLAVGTYHGVYAERA